MGGRLGVDGVEGGREVGVGVVEEDVGGVMGRGGVNVVGDGMEDGVG